VVGEQVDRDDSPVSRQAELDPSKLTLDYLASLPPSERRGGGIAKEVWDEFKEDYVATIVQHGQRTADKAAADKAAENTEPAENPAPTKSEGGKRRKPKKTAKKTQAKKRKTRACK
jgi:hypothetical protein